MVHTYVTKSLFCLLVHIGSFLLIILLLSLIISVSVSDDEWSFQTIADITVNLYY